MVSSTFQSAKKRLFTVSGFYVMLLIVLAIVIPVFSNALGVGDEKKCLVLCLSGSGSAGAYESGAIAGLTETLEPKDYAYDAVMGISAGGINALTSLGFKVGNETAWSSKLYQVWKDMKRDNVYKQWEFGVAEGLLLKTGIYDSEPLKESLTTYVKNYTDSQGLFTSDRMVSIGATNMENGRVKFWNEEHAPLSLVDSALASSALPGIFPAVTIDGVVYNDGNVGEPQACGDAVERCIRSGKAVSDADVVIDLIFCTPDSTHNDKAVGTYHSLGLLLRFLYLSSHQGAFRKVNMLKERYPNAYVRYVISPKKALPSGTLEFDSKKLQEMLDQGRNDAIELARNNITGDNSCDAGSSCSL